MSDRMPEIDSMKWGDPELKDGEIVVPLKARDHSSASFVSYYLTREKVEALRRGAEDALDALDEKAAELAEAAENARGGDDE